jgi:hypothetical protein
MQIRIEQQAMTYSSTLASVPESEFFATVLLLSLMPSTLSHHPKGKKQILLTEAAFVPSFHTNLVCIQKLNDKGVYWNNKERRLLEANSRNGQLNEESLLKGRHLILNRRTVQRNVLGG